MEEEPKPPDKSPPSPSFQERWRRNKSRDKQFQEDLEVCAGLVAKHLINKIKAKK